MAVTTLYKYASGWNNTAGLTLLKPQPKTHMTEYSQRYYSMSGIPFSQGRYTELIFDALSLTDFNTLNTQFGLSELIDATKGTFSLRKDNGAYFNVNAMVNYPFSQTDKHRVMGYWQAVTYRLTHVIPI